ncbi:MAG: glycosyltransferase family 2 protein, partial [Actinomycetes bacterium]
DEFGWVVGCDYRGLPADGEQIRNPIGASMGIRHWSFDLIGGFSHAVGRIGAVPSGDEETELFIRLRRAVPGALIVRDTAAVVFHSVPTARQTVKYFIRRCYHEGRSKAAMTETVGTSDGLSSERAYVIKTLVKGMGIHFASALNGDPAGLARAVMLPVGLAATTFGFGIARIQSRHRTS